MESDVTGLRYNLRGIAHHILQTIYTRINCQLSDAGRTADDLTRLADALQGYSTALDKYLTHTTLKSSALIYVADDNLRS